MQSSTKKVLTLACVVGAAAYAGIFAPSVRAAEKAPAAVPAPASGDVTGWVDQKLRDTEPKAEERRFDETGWLTDIRSALKLAEQTSRPIFLFTHDGRMGRGRC